MIKKYVKTFFHIIQVQFSFFFIQRNLIFTVKTRELLVFKSNHSLHADISAHITVFAYFLKSNVSYGYIFKIDIGSILIKVNVLLNRLRRFGWNDYSLSISCFTIKFYILISVEIFNQDFFQRFESDHGHKLRTIKHEVVFVCFRHLF